MSAASSARGRRAWRAHRWRWRHGGGCTGAKRRANDCKLTLERLHLKLYAAASPGAPGVSTWRPSGATFRAAAPKMPGSPGSTSPDARAASRQGRALRALAAALLAGGTAAAVLLLPGVTVAPEGTLDPANPYPISFKIADANFVPLENVNAYLVICYVAPAPAPAAQRCQSPGKTLLFKAGWRDHSLAADQSFSITLDDFMRLLPPAKLGAADISIMVEYQPWLVPVRQEKEFRFTTLPQSDGKLYWIARSLEDEGSAN
jgi:hypothetical protein